MTIADIGILEKRIEFLKNTPREPFRDEKLAVLRKIINRLKDGKPRPQEYF